VEAVEVAVLTRPWVLEAAEVAVMATSSDSGYRLHLAIHTPVITEPEETVETPPPVMVL
jgi:hypothetical protein